MTLDSSDRHRGVTLCIYILVVTYICGAVACWDTTGTDRTRGRGKRSASSNVCTRPLPGLNRLKSGVDITKVDLLPINSNFPEGFKSSVFQFTCSRGRTKEMAHSRGVIYDIFDQVSAAIYKDKRTLWQLSQYQRF